MITTSAQQAALIATEVIAERAIAANLPRAKFINLVHHKSMDGMGSNKFRIPVDSALGAARGGTEGVDQTPGVQLGMAASIEVSPAEGVLEVALITDDTVMRRLGGMPFNTVRAVLESGNRAAIMAMLAPDIERLSAMAVQKIEQDGLALLPAIPNTVGPAGGTDAPLELVHCVQSIYQMKTQLPRRPRSEWAFLFAPIQTLDLNTEAIATSGGVAGTLWGSGRADFDLVNAQPETEPGFIGTLFRQRCYEMDDELVPTANAGKDAVGALFSRSSPAIPPDSPALARRPGAFSYVERHWIHFAFEFDASLRSIEITMNARYIWTDLGSSDAVGLVSDVD